MLRLPRTSLVIAIIGLLLATLLTIPLIGADTTVFSGTFRIDILSIWAKLILLPATILSLLLARSELANSYREGTVYGLILMVTLASLILAGVGDIMMLILGILLSGLASFALVAYPRTDAATEAAMKFFVFASVASSVMIFGLTYWFAGTGSTLFSELSQLNNSPAIAVLGLLAVIIGLGYKTALVPFHFWSPDAYDGAPVSIAGFLSVVPKIGALFAFAQILKDLPVSSHWQLLIAIISVMSMTLGYLAALMQKNIVRLLAYSSIAQAGYFLLAIVAICSSHLAIQSLIVFSAAYLAMNLGAFSIVMFVGKKLDDFSGFGRKHTYLGIAMVIFLLSLVGIPPLAGFVGKFLLFGAAMDAGFTWLVIIAILNSVLSLAVYLPIIIIMYQNPKNKAIQFRFIENRGLINIVTTITFILTIIIGLFSQFILKNL
jgi:NADH-quinone oxidoreductase subunit N